MTKHISLKTLRIGFLSTFVALMAIVILGVSQVGMVTAAGYDTSIVRTHGVYNYDAPKQDAALNKPFYFRNDTKVTQTVTYQGQAFLVISAHQSMQTVFKQKGSFVFGLASNPKATLTVVVGGK